MPSKGSISSLLVSVSSLLEEKNIWGEEKKFPFLTAQEAPHR
jgi:hypothetical protein